MLRLSQRRGGMTNFLKISHVSKHFFSVSAAGLAAHDYANVVGMRVKRHFPGFNELVLHGNQDESDEFSKDIKDTHEIFDI